MIARRLMIALSVVFAWSAVACRGADVAPSSGSAAASAEAAPSQSSASSASSGALSAAPSASPLAEKKRVSIAAGAVDIRPLLADLPHPVSGKGAGFAGPVDRALDAEWITRLATAEIVEVTANRGGGSVSLRAKFADGKKAAIKLDQTGHPTDPRAEIAGYHVDRIVGFGRTAAVVGRLFAVSDLRAALVASGADKTFLERVDSRLVVNGGNVAAAMVAWHTAPLVEENAAPEWAKVLETKDVIAADVLSKVTEWSDLVVFDFLIDNPDRYSGGNVLRLGQGGALVFLDQGAAFGKNRREQKLTTMDRLEKVCRFRKAVLESVAALGKASKKGESLGELLQKSLLKDPLSPVLNEAQIAGVTERMVGLSEHIRKCKSKVGALVSLAEAER